MHNYGRSLVWGPSTAPSLFTGSCKSYSLRYARTRQLIEDGEGDYAALALHSEKGELSFEAQITDGSTNFLDLSTGPKIVVSGISGTVLVTRAVERWTLGQDKVGAITAGVYPGVTGGTGTEAGADLDAFTPAQTLSFIHPGSKIIYGTAGLGHASGVVHGLTITQEWTLVDGDPTPEGVIADVHAYGYLRTIALELLAGASAAAPAVDTVLEVTGAPAHAADHRIESSEFRLATKRGKMYLVNAVWIPAMEE